MNISARKKGMNMGEKLGKLIICDRCGEMKFLQYTGKTELDGGFTRVNHFEGMPDGWNWHNHQIGLLCPNCNAEYTEFLERFMQREKENE